MHFGSEFYFDRAGSIGQGSSILLPAASLAAERDEHPLHLLAFRLSSHHCQVCQPQYHGLS